jgi:hypothetical protein
MNAPTKLGIWIAVSLGCIFALWPRPPACAAGEESQSCQLVMEALKASEKIKPGMLRADLAKDFTSDGGISFPNEGRYTYRKCSFIKIDVEFDAKPLPSPLPKDSTDFSSDDRIKKVSRLYIFYRFTD